MAIRQPVGVILSIAPWNAPIILGVRSVAMPLACGNTVVFKASRELPAHPRPDRRVLPRGGPAQGRDQPRHQRAGRTPRKIVEALIAHPKVRRINFTGSTRVGRIIAETAGALPEAGAARARRQGAAHRPRRRRHRRGGQRRRLRRLRQCRPDLHVDREDRPRQQGRRRVPRRSSPPAPAACRPAIRAATSCSAPASAPTPCGASPT